MDFGLSGKRALVLGGSRGLGAAIASALAGEGVVVYAAARTIEDVDAGANVRPIKADLSDKASVEALIERVKAAGGVDILVNNGGGPAGGRAGRGRLGRRV